MICPHCEQELKIENYVPYNVSSDGKPATGKSLCCGKGVTLRRVIYLTAERYTGTNKVDDWGVKYEN